MVTRYLTLNGRMAEVLESRIHMYEDRYEMDSTRMLAALEKGEERETAEKLRWMFDFHALEKARKQTHMDGTPGRTTATCMRCGSQITTS